MSLGVKIALLNFLNNAVNFIAHTVSSDGFMNIMTLIISAVNIFIAFRVYQYTKRDVNPKLYVDSKILTNKESSKIYTGGIINEELINENFDKKGFPEIQHDRMLWQLKIANNGDHPATNVVVEYSIIIKRACFDYGIDEADILNLRFVDYKKLNRTIKFDYIPPSSEKYLNIISLYGEFPKADLIINKLISEEIEFITRPIDLNSYEHPDFNNLQDADHARKLLGAYKEN